MLVVIEGPDGVGKTTLINNLINMYPKIYDKFPLSFPTYKKHLTNSKTPQYLRDKLYDYLLNDKRGDISDLQFQYINLIDKVMQYSEFTEYKNRDKIYLIDRYKASGYVYGVSSMLDSNLFNGNEKFIRYVNEQMVSLIEDPSFDIFLYAEPEYVMKRIDKRNDDRSAYETEELIKVICREYVHYFNTFVQNGIMIDATQKPEDVVADVHSVIKKVLIEGGTEC
jgi:thymidylate kinase